MIEFLGHILSAKFDLALLDFILVMLDLAMQLVVYFLSDSNIFDSKRATRS